MASLPPGFRFHPTDEELVAFYLKRKVMRRSIDVNIIREVDLYKHEPWDLPAKSILLGRDLEWYFFSPRDKKYPNGLRTNRATEEGYWKATGKDRNVKKSGRVVGMKKTLVFYSGRAPHGQRTDWVMHEYRLDEEECGDAAQDLFVLCRVFKKSGVGPRSGEDRGPNTYDDDDALPENSPVEKRAPGQLALELMKAMGPQLVEPVEQQAEETEDQKVKVPELETPPAEEEKMAPVEQTESEELSRPATPLLSITDYTVGHDVGNVEFPSNMLDGYLLGDQPQDVEGGFWDSLPNITSDEELPGGNPLDVLESWTVLGGEQAGNLQPQQHQQQGLAADIGVGDFDTDDMLPPLVEEKESNSPDGKSSEARNFFRARSRPQRQPRDVVEMDLQRPFRMTDNLGGYDCSPPRLYNSIFEQHSATSADRADSSKTDPNTVATPWADAVEFAACDEQFDARCFDTSEQPLSFSGLYSDDLQPSHSAAGPSAEVGDDWGVDGFCDYFDVEDELRSLEGEENNGSSAGNGGGFVADGDAACPNAKADDEWRRPPGASELQEGSKLSATLMKILGSMPALPASAAECPPELKHRAVGASSSSRSTTINSIHVSAVTVTCTSDGAEGVYRQVLSGSWQTSLPGSTASTGAAQRRKVADAGKLACANCATGVARGGTLQRPVARGSSSGFVFVFVLGAVSALIWFLTLRTAWRVGSHVLRSLV